RPKRCELFWAKPDLACVPVTAAAHLESQRGDAAFFAQTNLSTCGFTRQITLLDNIAPRALQFIGQPLQQKFAFNFPIVCCWTVVLHEANMLNAMSLLSRFSRRRKFRWNALSATACFSLLIISSLANIIEACYSALKRARAGRTRVARVPRQG